VSLRTHYSADPEKDAAWAAAGRKAAVSEAFWQQEQEIAFRAFAGQRVFPEYEPQYTLIDPFDLPPPQERTGYMAIDPHPRVPHAMLWMYVDRGGNHVFYRDYWPSRMYGQRGDTPEDDDTYQIDDYVETIKLLESEKIDVWAPGGYANNGGFQDKPYRRIMDPYGKAVAANREMGKESQETFWDRYQQLGIVCEGAKKDWNAGRDIVGKRLRPRKIVDETGEHQRSQIVIVKTCLELRWELTNNRYPKLTPEQAAKKDPSDIPLPKRKHLTDLMRYIEITDPVFIERRTPYSLPPLQKGVSY